MEQNAIPDGKNLNIASQDEIWFVYLFLGFSLGLYSFNLSEFWSRGNFLEIGYFIISILFLFTPLWRKVYRTHMADQAKLRRKPAIYFYLLIYSLQFIFLIRQIGYLIKVYT